MEQNKKQEQLSVYNLPISMWPGFGEVKYPKFNSPEDFFLIMKAYWKEEDIVNTELKKIIPPEKFTTIMGALYRMQHYVYMMNDVLGYLSRKLQDDGQDVLEIVEEGRKITEELNRKYDEKHGTN